MIETFRAFSRNRSQLAFLMALSLATPAVASNKLSAEQIAALKTECASGLPNSCLTIAQHLQARNDSGDALEYYEAACRLGVLDACTEASQGLFKKGQIAAGLKLAQGACATANDNGEACFRLAEIAVVHGQRHQASLWMKRSCDQGKSEACDADVEHSPRSEQSK